MPISSAYFIFTTMKILETTNPKQSMFLQRTIKEG